MPLHRDEPAVLVFDGFDQPVVGSPHGDETVTDAVDALDDGVTST
jgi:hypothetical protein